jgi:hypothetical protein
LIGIDKREIYNIFMAKFRLLQVRGGGEEEQHFMVKFRVPHVRGGYTTLLWLSLEFHR